MASWLHWVPSILKGLVVSIQGDRYLSWVCFCLFCPENLSQHHNLNAYRVPDPQLWDPNTASSRGFTEQWRRVDSRPWGYLVKSFTAPSKSSHPHIVLELSWKWDWSATLEAILCRNTHFITEPQYGATSNRKDTWVREPRSRSRSSLNYPHF